jgi:hypothetical protein
MITAENKKEYYQALIEILLIFSFPFENIIRNNKIQMDRGAVHFLRA